MVAGLNKIQKDFLLQMLDQMSANNSSELSFTRDDVLLELGARTLNEHNQEKMPEKKKGSWENVPLKECQMCHKSFQRIDTHMTRTHYGGKARAAEVGEFAKL